MSGLKDTNYHKMAAPSTMIQKPSLSDSFLTSHRSSNGAYIQTGGRQEKGQERIKEKLPTRKIAVAHMYGYHLKEDNDDWIFDLDEEPRRKLGADEIKVKLYRRECRQLDVTPVGAYLRSPSSPVLCIKHYSLGPRGARALAVPLMLDSCITCLDLEGNDLGGEGAKNLMEALIENCSITELNLSNNSLGSAGAGAVEKILMQNNLIHSVTLSGNHFKDVDVDHFALVLNERKVLKSLNLSHNEFGDIAASVLGQALATNDTLESLDLSWNHIRPKGGKSLMAGIKENVGLKRLSVANNGLGDEGCGAAAVAISSNSSLLELDMSGNRITNTGLLAFASQIKTNETLQVLKLGNNLATGLGAQALGEAILESETSALRTLDLVNISVWETLAELLKTHAQTRPLKVVHGTVTRREVPRDQLEQQFKDDIMAAFKERESAQNRSTDNGVELKMDDPQSLAKTFEEPKQNLDLPTGGELDSEMIEEETSDINDAVIDDTINSSNSASPVIATGDTAASPVIATGDTAKERLDDSSMEDRKEDVVISNEAQENKGERTVESILDHVDEQKTEELETEKTMPSPEFVADT